MAITPELGSVLTNNWEDVIVVTAVISTVVAAAVVFVSVVFFAFTNFDSRDGPATSKLL
jgi:hypothetical protein